MLWWKMRVGNRGLSVTFKAVCREGADTLAALLGGRDVELIGEAYHWEPDKRPTTPEDLRRDVVLATQGVEGVRRMRIFHSY